MRRYYAVTPRQLAYWLALAYIYQRHLSGSGCAVTHLEVRTNLIHATTQRALPGLRERGIPPCSEQVAAGHFNLLPPSLLKVRHALSGDP